MPFLNKRSILIYPVSNIVLLLSQKLELTPGSEGYVFWHTMPVPIFIKFYFWNVTNADEVVNNKSRPILEQLGPYVYR